MRGLFITFEGGEGCGKSTQINLLADHLKQRGCVVHVLREPGGTPIGEEIRHTLKHSENNRAMAPETELLLMNASRAQLVREVIAPALISGDVILCDRFYDSTIAYQAFGRRLPSTAVQAIIDFAIGDIRPDLTLLLKAPMHITDARRSARAQRDSRRDRMEEADREFFARVEQGYEAIAAAEGPRVRVVDASQSVDAVARDVWKWVQPLVEHWEGQGVNTLKSLGEYNPDTLQDPTAERSRH